VRPLSPQPRFRRVLPSKKHRCDSHQQPLDGHNTQNPCNHPSFRQSLLLVAESLALSANSNNIRRYCDTMERVWWASAGLAAFERPRHA
jgi:hypothetical protein